MMLLLRLNKQNKMFQILPKYITFLYCSERERDKEGEREKRMNHLLSLEIEYNRN